MKLRDLRISWIWSGLCTFFLTSCGISFVNHASPDDFSEQEGICGSARSFPSGTGTTANPYRITKICHFNLLASEPSLWTASFRLEADLDLESTDFVPQIAFGGTFDGSGHTLSNWTGPNALFVTNSGTIKNLKLKNFQIVAVGNARPAILVGTNYQSGLISHCSVEGTVDGLPPDNVNGDHNVYWFVGGLVGINAGTIRHSAADIKVSGQQAVGGLVGQNEGGTIETSSVLGTVSAMQSGNNFGVGGLVGTHNGGSIRDSYSLAGVSGQNQVGGLIGFSNGSVKNCFSTGAVFGNESKIGGLVGEKAAGSVVSSYWDAEGSGRSVSAAGSPLTSDQMQSQSNFDGWDFDTVWFPPSSTTYLPQLR